MKYVVIRHYNDELKSCLGIYDDYKTAIGHVYTELYETMHDYDSDEELEGYKLVDEWVRDDSYDDFDYWRVEYKGETREEVWVYSYEEENENDKK